MLLRAPPHPLYGGSEFVRDPALIPPPESPVDFEIASVNLKSIPSKYRRQIVEFDGSEPPGTVIVDPHQRMLYLTLEDGKALRFGVGVGRDGFAWSGEALINMKRVWPRWVPPKKWCFVTQRRPNGPMACRAARKIRSGRVPSIFLRMAKTPCIAFIAPMNLSLSERPCLQVASGC